MGSNTIKLLASVCSALVLGIVALVPFHAPISVWLGTIAPDFSLLIKAWKELLMIMVVPLVFVLLRQKGVLKAHLKDRLWQLLIAYAGLHLVLVAVFRPDFLAAVAGLAIDLRYLLFFSIIYALVRVVPSLKDRIVGFSLVAAAVVLAFSLLQIFVLPKDILSHIGYDKETTIAPYLTIDKNEDYIRINGTLRGPNPLGAYVVMVIAIAGAYILQREIRGRIKANPKVLTAGGLLVASPAVLWSSHSRSAWLAAVVAAIIVAVIAFKKRIRLRWWLAIGAASVLLAGTAFYALKDTSFVANVIEHRNPEDTGQRNSNEGHIDSLEKGLNQALSQPLGTGPGSTGSASLLSDKPQIIENQYLFVAHETGWIGLALFMVISIWVLVLLWRNRSDWLCLGLFASGIGLMVIGLFLPVWADDTVSLLWWGLSAAAIGFHRKLK